MTLLHTVAPHAGAWVETLPIEIRETWSPVAPHAGAWVETTTVANYCDGLVVAPHAGAWVETNPRRRDEGRKRGRPPRGGVG